MKKSIIKITRHIHFGNKSPPPLLYNFISYKKCWRDYDEK